MQCHSLSFVHSYGYVQTKIIKITDQHYQSIFGALVKDIQALYGASKSREAAILRKMQIHLNGTTITAVIVLSFFLYLHRSQFIWILLKFVHLVLFNSKPDICACGSLTIPHLYLAEINIISIPRAVSIWIYLISVFLVEYVY